MRRVPGVRDHSRLGREHMPPAACSAARLDAAAQRDWTLQRGAIGCRYAPRFASTVGVAKRAYGLAG